MKFPTDSTKIFIPKNYRKSLPRLSKKYFSITLPTVSHPDEPTPKLHTLHLPTIENKPLPSPELSVSNLHQKAYLESWQVYTVALYQPIKNISDIYFLSHFQYKDQYIPALLAEQADTKINFYRYWKITSPAYEALIEAQFGKQVPQQILINLAQAAKIYPRLWSGMDSSEPSSLTLSLDEAFQFLNESAWLLEDAGFKIIIPARLTPKGKKRAKMRLRTQGKKQSAGQSATTYFSMDSLTEYQYQLAIGDELVPPEEWRQQPGEIGHIKTLNSAFYFTTFKNRSTHYQGLTRQN